MGSNDGSKTLCLLLTSNDDAVGLERESSFIVESAFEMRGKGGKERMGLGRRWVSFCSLLSIVENY